MVGYLTNAIALNITDRTFFSGFQDFAKVISPRSTPIDGFIDLGISTANNLIPAAGLRRSLVNMMNPYMMEFNDQWDRSLVSAGLGALVNEAPRVDFITGESVSSANGGINALLPFKVNQIKQDPVKQALFDIEFNSDAIVEELGRTGVKLTPAQLNQLATSMGSGELQKNLLNIVSQPSWQASVKEYKEKLKKGYRVSKESQAFYREVSQEIRKYADDALYDLKQQNPEMDEALTDYQLNQQNDRYGGLQTFYQE